jgi:hypothetical protein
MKMKTMLAGILIIIASVPAFAAKTATVEQRGDFVKITEAEKPAGAPVDRDAPDVLYIRKASIVRASVIFATRSTEFRVIVVTSGPVSTARFDDDHYSIVNDAKSYIYGFPNEASAIAFCEALLPAKN